MLLAKALRSSTLRLALLYVGLFCAATFILIGYVYWSTAGYLRSRSDGAIAGEQTLLLRRFDATGRAGLLALVAQRLGEPHLQDGIYLLADSAYAPLAGNLRRWPPALQGNAGWSNFRAAEWRPDAAEPPLLRATYATLADGSHLLVGRDIDELDEFVETIETALAWALALMLVLTLLAGLYVTRRTVGRIEAINVTSLEIMRSGLGRRIPLRGTDDEWDQLAANLNSMLDRIEALVQEVKHGADSIAHDLRTPLTRMRGRLERALDLGHVSEHDRELVADAIQELDRVLATFASLLRISQIEALRRRAAFRVVDLGEIAAEVAELLDAAAEASGARVTFRGSAKALVLGDRDLLFEALANLVDNAIKHAGPDELAVEVSDDERGTLVSIADRGPGIPPEERQHVFKRFYRLPRSRSTPGNGLGLSLVEAVVQLHDAAIELTDNEPGLRVAIRFPAIPTSTASAEGTAMRSA